MTEELFQKENNEEKDVVVNSENAGEILSGRHLPSV